LPGTTLAAGDAGAARQDVVEAAPVDVQNGTASSSTCTIRRRAAPLVITSIRHGMSTSESTLESPRATEPNTRTFEPPGR
jgi:hypothetical protein